MDDALTPAEIAVELGVTVRTVQRWIRSGRLPAEQVGGRFRVSPLSLAAVRAPGATNDKGATSKHGAANHTGHLPQASEIRTLLVANRGEIVARIARTARQLNMRVIGVRAPGDREPFDVDTTLDVPSYLDGTAIIAAAWRAQADAIHPGY
jgi:excisionase family DNA binding protein